MEIIKPKPLKRSSRIAIVSPSWGGPFHFPHILDRAIENLQTIFDLDVVEFPSARADSVGLYNDPKSRADDINRAFSDPSFDAIFATIGGNDSIRCLEYLDVDSILKNPKILMGYSDTVTFLTYLNSLGLVTFHGPTMMAGWAQVHNFPFAIDYYRAELFNPRERSVLIPFKEWSERYPDWANPEQAGQVDGKKPNTDGFVWIQGKGQTVGRLWGGCIEVVDWLKGTQYWPRDDFWKDRILIFETSEDKPTPEEVKFSLRNLGIQGIFEKISGILFGRARDYSDTEKSELYDSIRQVVSIEFGKADIPIVANLDFGHIDPNLILPLGIKYLIDSEKREIIRIESPFSQ